MPVITKKIIVFDFETWSTDTETCEVVQVAGVAMDFATLKIDEAGMFKSLMRPLDMKNFTTGAIKVNGLTPEKVKDAPPRELVWQRFAEFVWSYNLKGKSPFTAPIAAGKNIRSFDLPIAARLCKAHGQTDKGGNPNLFSKRETIDLEDDLMRWFGHTDEMPDLKMDTVRKYMGMSTDGAHDAGVDVLQTAEMLRRFFQLYRSFFPKVRFKDSFAEALT